MENQNQPDESAIREEYRAKVASIPQALLDEFVPRVKGYRRIEARSMEVMFGTILPYNQEMDDIMAEIEAANPGPEPGSKEYIKWHESCGNKMRAVITERHPDLWEMAVRAQAAGQSIMKTAENSSKVYADFIAKGGTDQQWKDLDQAVLFRVFSRNDPPSQPGPAAPSP